VEEEGGGMWTHILMVNVFVAAKHKMGLRDRMKREMPASEILKRIHSYKEMWRTPPGIV